MSKPIIGSPASSSSDTVARLARRCVGAQTSTIGSSRQPIALIVRDGFGIADQAQVGLIVFHRFVDAVRMQILEPHVGLGILAEELLQIAVHVVQADRIDRGHAHPAGHFFVQRADLSSRAK